MIKELNRLVVASALAFAVCLSACGHAYADSTDVPIDRSLFEGVFAGDANPAAPPVQEKFELYDGPFPADRPSSFWKVYEFKKAGRGISEKDVYHALLRHFDRKGKKDWEIGIGAGGQLYSWRGPWGEAIAPQAGPWMDEVWQATLHSPGAQQVLNAIRQYDKSETNFNGTVGEAFVHGSGSNIRPNAYTPEEFKASSGMNMFFLPMLARWYDAESKSYSMINLGQSPTQPTVLHHKILFYSRYRYLGDGVLEVENVAFNFGEYEYGRNGIPWGGVRTTTYPELFISESDGSYSFLHQYFGQGNFMRKGPQTDGWMGSAAKKDDPKCQAFGFVFGRDFPAAKDATGNKKGVNCAFGRGQMDKPDGQPGSRAYTVMASNVGGKLGPGQSFWVRYYLIVGTMENVVRNAREYEKKVDYNALNLAEEQATVQPLYRKTLSDGTVTLTRDGSKGAEPVCRVYNEPVLNSKPLFVIRELPDGRSIVTTDPYGLCRRKPYKNPLPKDHKLHGKLENTVKYYTHESEAGKRLQWKLLGFVMQVDQAKADPDGYVKLATIVNSPGNRGMLALGCTKFDYSNLKVTKLQDDAKQVKVKITADIRNTGKRKGIAAARLYIKDMAASVPVPASKRVGGGNVSLRPGEKKTVEFLVDGKQLSLIDRNEDRIVEPGEFKVMIGRTPQDILLEDKLKVIKRVEVQQGPRYRQTVPVLEGKVETNTEFTVNSEVENTGGTKGIREFDFLVDGKRVTSKKLRLEPG